MNFLTIEKFNHHSRNYIKIILLIILFVVPLLIAAWVLMNLEYVNYLIKVAQAATDEQILNRFTIK